MIHIMIYDMETHYIYYALAVLILIPFVMDDHKLLKGHALIGTIGISWLCSHMLFSQDGMSNKDMAFAATASIIVISFFYGTVAGRLMVLKQEIDDKPVYAQISLTMLASIICSAIIAGITGTAYVMVA